MENFSANTKKYIKYILVALGIVLIILCVALFLEYRNLRRSQIIRAHGWQFPFAQNHKPLTSSDVNLIRSWMTFDYLNKAFNLPPEYLKTQLSISDIHYPRLSLSHYVKNHNIDADTFLTEVKNAVHNYSNSKH